MTILYVYAITRTGSLPECEGVDGTKRFGSVAADGVAAVYSTVDRGAFSQESIDARAKDLEWLGAIGYRHQEVVGSLMKNAAVVPLRAFTLFTTAEALLAFLRENQSRLAAVLERLDGKREWTLRIEFEPLAWSEALSRRVPALAALESEIASAAPGKAFLLRKKRDEERKRASKEAEQTLVGEIERAIADRLACETFSETRQERDGAFPQINVLLPRDEEHRLEEIRRDLGGRYEADGVTLALTGPWPPYTFATL